MQRAGSPQQAVDNVNDPDLRLLTYKPNRGVEEGPSDGSGVGSNATSMSGYWVRKEDDVQPAAQVARQSVMRTQRPSVTGSASVHRFRPRLTSTVAAVTLALVCSACTGATPGAQGQGSTGPATSDAFIAATLQVIVIAPSTTSPATLNQAAHALDCVSFMPGPNNPGGPRWEVHLRVAGVGVATAIAALKKIQGVSDVAVIPQSQYSPSPSGSGTRLGQALPC